MTYESPDFALLSGVGEADVDTVVHVNANPLAWPLLLWTAHDKQEPLSDMRYWIRRAVVSIPRSEVGFDVR